MYKLYRMFQVKFSCPPGYQLLGPNNATCRDDMNWYPSPPLCEGNLTLHLHYSVQFIVFNDALSNRMSGVAASVEWKV